VYIFGNSLDIKNVTIDGKVVAVRLAPESAIAYEGETGLGSCPFLYIESRSSAKPISLGRILVGASSQAQSIDDQIQLPVDTNAIYIVEREPEITYVSDVSVWDENAKKERVLLEGFTVSPGEAKEIRIPVGIDATKVRIRGYYETLDKLIAGGE
jgi:hypothetical protein